jgi:TetR/AcrR family transcriptional regulator
MTSAPVDQLDRRMTASERREAVLDAASAVFGDRGYIGATTDQIARAAGISQPYVVRMFGSKENLFVEVIDRARRALLGAFRTALEGFRAAGSPGGDPCEALGSAYIELVRDRGLHTSLMHAFMQGTDPVVGPAARACFLEIWHFVRDEAGLDPEAARNFIADGMLINVLLGLDMPRNAGRQQDAAELLGQTFGEKLGLVVPE